MRKEQIRTCISCNTRLLKSELNRYVWNNGSSLPDPEQKAPGRGAYHCKNDRCKELFNANRKRLDFAFRLT